MNHSHYFKSVKHLDHIDVYRVLGLFGVTDAALGHAAKKILCAGIRGAKDQAKDVQEAIDTLLRWQQMQAENALIAESPEWQDKELPSSGIYQNQTLGNPQKFDVEQFVKCQQSIHDGMTADQAINLHAGVDKLIYSDAGYTAEDQQAASLVHDAELNPDLVALCANTTIHDDEDGWIRHVGNDCPVSDGSALVQIKTIAIPDPSVLYERAECYVWDENRLQYKGNKITHWRYYKK